MPIAAICGKGGAGKTTVAALLVEALLRAGAGSPAAPLLVVDGDPASTLHFGLGLPAPPHTLADFQREVAATTRSRSRREPTSIQALLDQLQVVMLARPELHLLSMGQSEGPGCYCAINAGLGAVLPVLLHKYRWVVLDNEAGVEHLSRVRVAHVDFLLVLTTPAPSYQAVAQRIVDTARQVGMTWEAAGLVVNRATDLPTQVTVQGLPVWATLPEEPRLAELEQRGEPAVHLPPDTPIRQALATLAEQMLRGVVCA